MFGKRSKSETYDKMTSLELSDADETQRYDAAYGESSLRLNDEVISEVALQELEEKALAEKKAEALEEEKALAEKKALAEEKTLAEKKALAEEKETEEKRKLIPINIMTTDKSIEFSSITGDRIKYIVNDQENGMLRYINNENPSIVSNIYFNNFSELSHDQIGDVTIFDHGNDEPGISIWTFLVQKDGSRPDRRRGVYQLIIKDLKEIINKYDLGKKIKIWNYFLLFRELHVSSKCEPKEETGSGMTENIIIVIICLSIYLLVNKNILNLDSIINIIQERYIIILVSLFAIGIIIKQK